MIIGKESKRHEEGWDEARQNETMGWDRGVWKKWWEMLLEENKGEVCWREMWWDETKWDGMRWDKLRLDETRQKIRRDEKRREKTWVMMCRAAVVGVTAPPPPHSRCSSPQPIHPEDSHCSPQTHTCDNLHTQTHKPKALTLITDFTNDIKAITAH